MVKNIYKGAKSTFNMHILYFAIDVFNHRLVLFITIIWISFSDKIKTESPQQDPTTTEIPMSDEVKVMLAQGQGQTEGQILMENPMVLNPDTQVNRLDFQSSNFPKFETKDSFLLSLILYLSRHSYSFSVCFPPPPQESLAALFYHISSLNFIFQYRIYKYRLVFFNYYQ